MTSVKNDENHTFSTVMIQTQSDLSLIFFKIYIKFM